MKNLYRTLTLIFTLLFGSCHFDNDNLSIAVKKTDEAYHFDATYPKGKTKSVVKYIESTLKDENIFKGDDDQINEDIALADGTRFYLKVESGLIVINFKKPENSHTSYKKMEELCMGIKALLQD